ncbi:MAG TPA: MFS transporter [Solirubrobacterales bacterium]|nr:MFS transporter [Solirubrobacterales bacterium]
MTDSRRGLLTLVATILGSTIVFLDATVVNVALPAISDDLDTGLADQQWVVEAYLLAMVSLLLVGGSLGDQFGRKRIFVIGLVAFGITSVLCAVAPSSAVLIGARAAQGLAGALLVPGSLAILASTFEGAARGKAVGTWTAWTGIATVLGPAGGGALIEALSWRAIFWVNVPLIVVTIVVTMRIVRESKDPRADRAIDWAGIGMSAAGLGLPVYALIQQPTHGWSDPTVYGPLIAGVLLFCAFIVWESRAPHAMLDLMLFRIRNFSVTNIETLIVYAGLIGAFFFVTLFLQETLGYTPLEAGLATTPISLLLFALSPRFGKIATGIGPRLPMSVGPIVGGVGLLMLIGLDADSEYLSGVLPGVLVFGLGLSATVAPLTATALDSVEERHVGIASGINNGVSRVAGLLAIAILGAVISGSFATTVDDRLSGQQLSPAAERAIEKAKEKPFGAARTQNLSGAEVGQVDAAVTEASEGGFHLGMALSGGLMIVGGLIAGSGLRNPKRPEEPREAPRAAPAGDCGHCPPAEEPAAAGREREPVGQTV